MSTTNSREGRILIIEDNFDIQLSARLLLKQHFAEVKAFANPEEAVQEMRRQAFDVVVLDMNFSRGETSGREGIHWLNKIISLNPNCQVIMITAFGDIQLAIEAIKAGARDFMLKPWDNEKLLGLITDAFKASRSKPRQTKHENINIPDHKNDYAELTGTSAATRKVIESIEKAGPLDANILLIGEAGTGKELVARTIHHVSNRSVKPFIKAETGGLPEQVAERELFGSGKENEGLLQAAAGGTLYFPEITDLSPALQNRLMTYLTGNPQAPRIISASKKSLTYLTAEGNFNRELLYKLNTLEILLPALRERTEDISPLAELFLTRFSRKYGKAGMTLALPALEKLRSYRWPENVRELKQVIERAVILCDHHVLTADDLILDPPKMSESELHTLNLEDLEKDAIRIALLKYRGNISQAARELGLTRSALYRRLEKYGF